MDKNERVKLKREKVKELFQSLEDSANAYFASGDYRKKLRDMAMFLRNSTKYSARNYLLMQHQRSEVSVVESYKRWQEMGRQVMKGEIALSILAPIFSKKSATEEPEEKPEEDLKKKGEQKAGEAVKEKERMRIERTYPTGYIIVSVFDISQTFGKDLPISPTRFGGDKENFQTLLDCAKRAAGVKTIITPETYGFGRLTHGGIFEPFITVNDSLSEEQTLSVLFHEYAHYKLHTQEETRELAKEIKEAEAELTAYVVSEYYGIDSEKNSSEYLTLYGLETTKGVMLERFERIYNASKTIIEEIDAELSKETEKEPLVLEELEDDEEMEM